MKISLQKFAGFGAFLVFLSVTFSSCRHDHSPDLIVNKKGTLELDLKHWVNGSPLVFDTLMYTTSLGSQYMVNEIQYFLSRPALHQMDGKWISIPDAPGIRYFEARNPDNCKWLFSEEVPAGTYDSLRFTFGLDENDNLSGRFPDPPERDMFWPEILGGGYHYMKMNLKWKNDGMQETLPFMFHIGIGQMYDGTTQSTDSIIGYIQNYFAVTLPVSLKIDWNKSTLVNVYMFADRWLDAQNAFDFSLYPMGIMQNQEGMFKACMNGRHVFDIPVGIGEQSQ